MIPLLDLNPTHNVNLNLRKIKIMSKIKIKMPCHP